MYIPPSALYQHETPPPAVALAPIAPRGVSASSAIPQLREKAGGQRIAYLYTSGADIVGMQTRASVTDYLLRRSLGGAGMIDDLTLAESFPASGTAFACTTYIANKVAEIPLRILNARREPLATSPLDQFLQDSAQIKRLASFSSTIWGRSYLRKLYNVNRYAPTLEYINPSLVYEIPGRDGYVETYQVRDVITREIVDIPAREMIYTPDFDSRADGMGISKFEVAWRPLNVEVGIVTYQAAYFVNHATPDGILSFEIDPDPEILGKVEDMWRVQFKGVGNSHRTAILPGGAKWTSISTDPDKTALTETNDANVKRICSIFGVNPILIGMDAAKDPLGATTTFNAVEVQFVRAVAIPFLKQVLLPQLNIWAGRDFLDPYIIEVDEARIPEFAESNLARASTAGQLANDGIVTIAEARGYIGLEPDETGLARDPAKLLSMLLAGSITLDVFAQMIGTLKPGQRYEGGNGNIVIVNGTAIPFNRYNEYANLNVDEKAALVKQLSQGMFADAEPLINPANDNNTVTVTPEPVPELPSGLEEPRTETDTSLCIGLSLAKNPDLMRLQLSVKSYCEKQGITGEWNAPDTFHVTLAYSAECTEEQAALVSTRIAAIPVPPLSLVIGSLRTFEDVGTYPVHLRIRRNDALLDYQRACYEAIRECGLMLSSFSEPEMYIPHITMGYTDKKPADWTYKSKLSVKPSEVLVWHGEGYNVIYEKPCGDAPEEETVEPTPSTFATRAEPDKTIRTVMALRFSRDGDAAHPFIAQACRALDAALIAAEQPNPDWIARDNYRLPLVALTTTADRASKLIRQLDVSDQRVLDLWTKGYALNGNTVYLTLEPSPELDTFCKSLVFISNDLNIRADAPPVIGIPLCTLRQEIDPALLPTSCERLPLVGVALALYRDDSVRHVWELTGESEARSSELKAYRKQKTGHNAARAFKFDALRNHPAAQWLNDAHEAGVEIDDALEIARAILAGSWSIPETRSADYLDNLRIVGAFTRLSLEDTAEDALDKQEIASIARGLIMRTYRETRAAFIKAVYDIISKARGDEGSRRKFGGAMRTAIRQSGLQVIFDVYKQIDNPIESLSEDDLTLFRAWQAETSDYISKFGTELFKEGGIADNEVEIRANMWANKTLDDLYYTFMRHAAPTMLTTWHITPGKDHCRNEGSTYGCLERDGESATLDEWGKKGFPRDRRLTCGGWECECFIKDKQGKVLRAFPDEPAEYLSLPHENEQSIMRHVHDEASTPFVITLPLTDVGVGVVTSAVDTGVPTTVDPNTGIGVVHGWTPPEGAEVVTGTTEDDPTIEPPTEAPDESAADD